jgi:hypothetical protein
MITSRTVSRTPLHLFSQLCLSALPTGCAPGNRGPRLACAGRSPCSACTGSGCALCDSAAGEHKALYRQARGSDVGARSPRGPDLDAVRAAQLRDGSDGLVEAVLREEAQLPAPVHLQQAPQVAGLRGGAGTQALASCSPSCAARRMQRHNCRRSLACAGRRGSRFLPTLMRRAPHANACLAAAAPPPAVRVRKCTSENAAHGPGTAPASVRREGSRDNVCAPVHAAVHPWQTEVSAPAPAGGGPACAGGAHLVPLPAVALPEAGGEVVEELRERAALLRMHAACGRRPELGLGLPSPKPGRVRVTYGTTKQVSRATALQRRQPAGAARAPHLDVVHGDLALPRLLRARPVRRARRGRRRAAQSRASVRSG